MRSKLGDPIKEFWLFQDRPELEMSDMKYQRQKAVSTETDLLDLFAGIRALINTAIALCFGKTQMARSLMSLLWMGTAICGTTDFWRASAIALTPDSR